MLEKNGCKKSYVYIVCPGHSGSTLLSILLNTHPNISSPGEYIPFFKVGVDKIPKCSCGNHLNECEFWNKVETLMSSKGYSYFKTFNNSSLPIDFSNKLTKLCYYYPSPSRYLEKVRDFILSIDKKNYFRNEQMVKFCSAVAESVMCVENSDVFVDATKNIIIFKLLSRGLNNDKNLDFKVIHLVRDPRGVVNSLRIKQKRRDLRISSIEEAAMYWVKNHRLIEYVKKDYTRHNQVLLVRYSDLCKNPEKEMKDIGKFLGVEYDFQLNNIDNKNFHIFGNNMRNKPVEAISHDRKWESTLSKSEQETILRIAKKFCTLYGLEES